MIEQFEIDVEETTQENGLFKGDEFICYADDVETIIKNLNELNDENEYLIKKRGELEIKNVILKGENEDLKKRISELDEMCIKLQKENEYLIKTKDFYKYFQKDARELETKNVILKKENNQLKKELDQFYLLIGRGDWSGLIDSIIKRR